MARNKTGPNLPPLQWLSRVLTYPVDELLFRKLTCGDTASSAIRGFSLKGYFADCMTRSSISAYHPSTVASVVVWRDWRSWFLAYLVP